MGLFDVFKRKKEDNEINSEKIKLNENIVFIMSIFKDILDNQFNYDKNQLKDNGSIYYMNGQNGTKFDWNTNEHLSPFYVFYKNGNGAIKLIINKDGTIVAFLYDKGKSEPYNNLQIEVSKEMVKNIAVLMYSIADSKGLFDQPISNLDFTYISNENDVIEFEKED